MIFKKGDLVQIRKYDKKKDSNKLHFPNDCRGIILYSYTENCLGGVTEEKDQYGIFIENKGSNSWYHPEDLTLIKSCQSKLLKQWEKELDERYKKEEQKSKGKKYFSGFQIMCMSGRCQDECDARGINWDDIKNELAEIVSEDQKDGKADYGRCHEKLFKRIDEFKPKKKKVKKCLVNKKKKK